MNSWLFVLLIACSIAYVSLGDANTHQTRLSNAKTYKQYSLADLDTPTAKPTTKAKASPTAKPVTSPTAAPILEPTAEPIVEPTVPSESPIAEPTANPIVDPTISPTFLPSEQPVAQPTANPVVDPTIAPTFLPSEQPIAEPTANPVVDPTMAPTFLPSEQPIAQPTEHPVAKPSTAPTFHPTEMPIAVPTYAPTNKPVLAPTPVPTGKPIATPTAKPVTRAPTAKRPSARPTRKPTMRPSRKPTMRPSRRPTRKPTAKPKSPTRKPTRKPTMRPTTRSQRRPICRVSQTFSGVTMYGYEQDPEGCNNVILATIVASIKGINTDNILDPEVYEQATDDGNLRVSALENAPQGVTLEYTIAVDPDSPLNYDKVSTQLVESVNSHQFNDMLHQYALELNVTQLASATSQSVETSEASSGTDSSARGSSDALKDDAVVGIAVGLCAALLLAAYFARLYVLRRAASSSRTDSVEMTAKSLLNTDVAVAHTADHEEGWTDNPLSAYSSHGPNPAASQGVSSVIAMPVSTNTTVAEPCEGSEV